MKRVALIPFLVVTFVALCAFALAPSGSSEYVGADACKMCHNTDKGGKVYAVWEKTKHANAFKALQTAEADKIAKEKGFKTKAAETDECLGCHVTGMNAADAKFDKKFDKTAGVQCESCHGAGSGYKTKHMKEKDAGKLKAMGMDLPKVDDGSAEKLCKTCHNEKSPTYKDFDLKKYWGKIAHGLSK